MPGEELPRPRHPLPKAGRRRGFVITGPEWVLCIILSRGGDSPNMSSNDAIFEVVFSLLWNLNGGA